MKLKLSFVDFRSLEAFVVVFSCFLLFLPSLHIPIVADTNNRNTDPLNRVLVITTTI